MPGIGKLSVWSKANGLKDAAPASPIYEVDSSDDGSRVAFVRSLAAEFQLVTSTPTIAAGSVVVVEASLGDGSAANPCAAIYRFVGQNLFTSTCTGAGITATARVPAGTTLRIDTGLAPRILSVNGAGDKVFSAKRIVSTGTGGAAAVYSVGVPVAPTELVPDGGVTGILATSLDRKSVLTHKLDHARAGRHRARFRIHARKQIRALGSGCGDGARAESKARRGQGRHRSRGGIRVPWKD